jgi:hypothetical protein
MKSIVSVFKTAISQHLLRIAHPSLMYSLAEKRNVALTESKKLRPDPRMSEIHDLANNCSLML